MQTRITDNGLCHVSGILLLQRRKTALLGWTVNVTICLEGKKIPAHMTYTGQCHTKMHKI
jgi:hypothetical protein